MTGAEGSVAMLAEHLVRIVVGHVVSSSSMVSRAYLTDGCVGVVVDAGERGLFLVSSLAALAPDPDGLRVRAAEKGGIPVDAGVPRLVKITLGWDGSSVDLNNPVVAAGSLGAGAVSLAVPTSLGDRIRSGDGPRPIEPCDDVGLGLGDRVAVLVMSESGPMVRWAHVASDLGFGQRPRAVALDVGLSSELAGSPVFRLVADEAQFCGVAEALDATTSLLIPVSALEEAISTGL